MSGWEKGWRYNPFSGLTFALSAAFRTCSLTLSLSLSPSASRSLYMCVYFIFNVLLSDTCCHLLCVCVCVSAVWERVRVVVCRLCLALFITQPNDEFIFLCFVFFSHARHVQLVILCAYHRMSYFACLPQLRPRRWRQPALACLLSLPVLFVFLSPFWQASKKAKWCVMASRDMCHICYSYAVLSVLVAFVFFTCNVLQAKKKWVLAAV